MTEGDRPTKDSSPVSEVSDDTDVYPIDFAPPAPPARPAVPPPPSAQPPYQAAQPGYPHQSSGYPQPSYTSPPPGYSAPPGYQQQYPGYPPQPYPAYPGYPVGRQRGIGRGLNLFLVVMLVLLVGLVGLIAGLASGIIRYNDIARLLGMAPGEMYVQNLRDDSITVTVQRLDGQSNVTASYEDQLGPADVRTYPNRETGPWDIRFVAADGTDLGTCRMTVGGNGHFTFMVLPDIVVVSSAGQAVTRGDDFVIGTSRLCQRT